MPDAMSSWLVAYQSAMSSSRTLDTQDLTWEGPEARPVAPLIKTKWNQNAPFNCKCPGNRTKRTLAGCVPVAMAQVLNFYHQDRKGGGSLDYVHSDTGSEYTIDYSNTSYDWNNMLDDYSGTSTQQQQEAVGKLMLECGIACKAAYDYESTSASLPFVALNKYYNYECMYVDRDYHSSTTIAGINSSDYYISTSKWMSMIKDELYAGRPIIYSATEGNGYIYLTPPVSHCFIIDGIDANNLLHVNWGWGGKHDGYYDIALLNPDISYNYDRALFYGHAMVIGIKPRETEYKEAVYTTFIPYNWYKSSGSVVKSRGDVVTQSDASSDNQVTNYGNNNRFNNAAYYHLVRNSYESKQVKFTVVLTQNGEIKQNLTAGYYNTNVAGWPYTSIYNLKNNDPTGITYGKYEIRLAYYDENNKLQLCPTPDALVLRATVLNNKFFIVKGLEGDDLSDYFYINEITPASKIYSGTAFYLYMKGTGRGCSSELRFRDVNTDKVYGGTSSKFSIYHTYDSITSKQIYRFEPRNIDNNFSMPAGRYKLELPSDKKYIKFANDFYIDVEEKPEYPILDGQELSYISYYNDNDAEIKANGGNILKNTTILKELYPNYKYANNVKDPVTLTVYLVNKDTGEETLVTRVNEWEPGHSIDVNTYFYPLVGNYEFRCRYTTPEGERGGIMPDEYYDKEPKYNYQLYSSDGTYLINCELVSCRIYNAAVGSSDKVFELGIQPRKSQYIFNTNDAGVKVIFWDKENSEVIIETVDDIVVPRDKVTTITMHPQLKPGATYDVSIMYKYTQKDYYGYVLTGADNGYKPANFRYTNRVETGLSEVKGEGCEIFKEGELVTVCNMEGKVCKVVTASENMMEAISNLPTGMYILKTADKTIKLINK